MSGTSLDTLFLPLEEVEIPVNNKILFMGAENRIMLKTFDDVYLYQPFKPLADGLAHNGYQVFTELSDKENYNLILIHCPKQVEEAQFWLAYAVEHLNKDGVLVVSAANDAGGGRLGKWMKDLGFDIQQISKHKSRVVWGVRPDKVSDILLLNWKEKGIAKTLKLTDEMLLKTQVGLFSWDRVDKGSALLIENFSKDLKGIGADFVAGIGVLGDAL